LRFIEYLFHISPDGGSGVLEIAIVMAVLLVPAAIAARRLLMRRRSD